jgi:hypothetical protein
LTVLGTADLELGQVGLNQPLSNRSGDLVEVRWYWCKADEDEVEATVVGSPPAEELDEA